jgi:hypothetical protein
MSDKAAGVGPAQVVGVATDDFVVGVIGEVEPNVLQGHRPVGMLVQPCSVLLELNFSRHFFF